MLTPRDPDAFRATVLRRAMQIERRRQRGRVLMALPALVAVVLAGVVVADRGGNDPATVAAGQGTGALTSEVIDVSVEPWALTAATDGAMWVLSRGVPASLTRLAKGDDTVTFDLPAGAQPEVIVAGTDEAIWLADTATSSVVRVTEDGDVTSWPTDSPPSASGTWLGGRFWFAEPELDRLTGIAPDGDTVHHAVPEGRAPTVVAAGPDGAVWFASSTAPRVGSVSATGNVNELDLGSDDERAISMATGPGPALWLVLASDAGTRLAHVDALGAVVGEEIAATAPPAAISLGPDGRIWFSARDGIVHQQSLSKLTVREVGRPLLGDSWALAVDDSMWTVDRVRQLVVRITVE